MLIFVSQFLLFRIINCSQDKKRFFFQVEKMHQSLFHIYRFLFFNVHSIKEKNFDPTGMNTFLYRRMSFISN